VRNMLDPQRTKPFDVAIYTMPTRSQPHHGRPGCQRACRADLRIFKDDALCDGHRELVSGMEIKVGRRLSAFDMLCSAVEMPSERIGYSELFQMSADPLCGTGRCNGFRQAWRKRLASAAIGCSVWYLSAACAEPPEDSCCVGG